MPNLIFPTTAKALIAYQEKLAGRSINKNERDTATAWTPVINQGYEYGLENNVAALCDSLDILKRSLSQYRAHPAAVQFLRGVRKLIVYAWEQGRADAGRAGSV